MENFNSNQYREMYQRMGVDIDKLGCIMLDIDGAPINKYIDDGDLYFTEKKERFWINGFVAGHTPHVTLLYGLLYPVCNQLDVDTVLNGWSPEDVIVSHVGFFASPYDDDPYYCIVAHLRISPNLLEAHRRLELLPHINTFPDYKAHITIAYIRKDDELRDSIIYKYNQALKDNALKVVGINYGKNQNALLTK